MNVGIRKRGKNKDLIFFEVSQIHLPTMQKAINSLPEENLRQLRRKKQAKLLFDFIKKQPQNKEGFVNTHPIS